MTVIATDIERLSVLIEANTKSYERAMARIEQKTDKAIRASTRSVKSLDAALKTSAATALSVGRTFATAFGAGAVFAGLATLPSVIQKTVAEVANMGDMADKIGITTDRLQELHFQAQQNGSSAEALDSALEQFSRRIGLAATGTGELLKILKANGVALRDENGQLRPLNDLLASYANLIKNAANDQDRAVLATEAFGKAGDHMSVVLAGGSDEMTRMSAEAQRLGGILGVDLVRDAQRIDDKFAALTTTVTTFLKGSAVEFAADIEQLVGEFEAIFNAIQEFRSANQAAEAEIAKAETAERIQALTADIAATESQVLQLQAAVSNGGVLGPHFENSLNLNLDRLAVLRQQLVDLQAVAAQTAAAIPRTVSESRTKDDVVTPTVVARPTIVPFRTGGGGGGGSRSAAVSEADRQKKAVAELIAELEHELSLVGMSEVQQRIANETRQAGAAATDEQKAQIADLVTQIETEQAAQAQLIDTMDQVRDVSGTVLSDITSGLREGASGAEILNSVLNNVLDTMLKMAEQSLITALFGAPGTTGAGSGLGSLIASAFGGKFAQGGTLGAGKWGIAGESGPEIIRGPATVAPLNAANANQASRQEVAVGVRVEPSPFFITTVDSRINSSVRASERRMPGMMAEQRARYG